MLASLQLCDSLRRTLFMQQLLLLVIDDNFHFINIKDYDLCLCVFISHQEL